MIAEELRIVIEAEVNKAVAELKKLNKAQGDTEKSTKGISLSQIKAAAATAGLGIALTKTYRVLLSWGKAASDAEEITSKYNTVFKDLGQEASTAAKSLADNYGLAETSAKELLSATGDLLTGFGFSQDAALDLSSRVNELAVDLASFTNFSGGAEGASAALTKALLGETESAKSLGIVINQNSDRYKELIRYYTQSEGLTEQQAKAYAALAMATEQSKNAVGDYARTADSTANTVRRFGEAQKSLSEELGVVVAKRATPIIRFLADYATQAAEVVKQINALQKITDEGVGAASIDDLTSGLIKAEKELENLKGLADETTFAMTGISGASEKELTAARNLVSAIKLQIMEKENLSEAEANWAAAKTKREQELAQIEVDKATKAAEAAAIATEQAEAEAERIERIRDLNIESAQQVQEAKQAAMDAEAEHTNRLIALELQNRKDLAEEQQKLAGELIDTYGFLAESVGMALVDSSKGWDYFKEQGKNAVIGVLKGFAKQWAAQSVAYYGMGNFPQGSAMAGAAFGALAAAGAVKAFAQGGSFVTNEPEMIMVGDNASGRERVDITPLGTNDASGMTHVQVYLSERIIIDAMTRASADGRLIISQRGIR